MSGAGGVMIHGHLRFLSMDILTDHRLPVPQQLENYRHNLTRNHKVDCQSLSRPVSLVLSCGLVGQQRGWCSRMLAMWSAHKLPWVLLSQTDSKVVIDCKRRL